MIMVRTLRRDIAKYNKDDDLVCKKHLFFFLAVFLSLYLSIYLPIHIFQKFIYSLKEYYNIYYFLQFILLFLENVPEKNPFNNVNSSVWFVPDDKRLKWVEHITVYNCILRLFLIISIYCINNHQDETIEETGWKLVHGDVFRPPPHSKLLTSFVGAGIQIFFMALITICKFMSLFWDKGCKIKK